MEARLEEAVQVQGNLVVRVHDDSARRIFCTSDTCKKEIHLGERYGCQVDVGGEFPFHLGNCYMEQQFNNSI